jgi:hypothetical protein
VLCSWESPFANRLSGAPSGDYLSRAIVGCRGAPTVDTAFMGLTSCRRITIAETLAHGRREHAIDIVPTAVSLSTRRRPLHPHLLSARCRHGPAVGGQLTPTHQQT